MAATASRGNSSTVPLGMNDLDRFGMQCGSRWSTSVVELDLESGYSGDGITPGLSTAARTARQPELNPAERVFQEVRRWVEGRVYESLEEKVKAVDAYLSELESDPERVRSLAAWDWIEDNVQRLPAPFMALSK